MLALSLALLLHVGPPPPFKLAAPGWVWVNMKEDVGAFYADHFAHAMTLQGANVITARQIQALMGFERQRQLLGCSGNTECMAELANALGVDGLVVGQVGKFEDVYQLDIKILSARSGDVLAAYAGQAAGDKKLLAELDAAAARMVSDLNRALQKRAAPAGASVADTVPAVHADGAAEWAPMRRWSWLPAAVGVLAGVGGGILYAHGNSLHNTLASGSASIDAQTAATYRTQGPQFEGAGVALLVVGAAGLGTASVMFALGGTQPVAVALSSTGRSLSLSGTFP